MRVLWCHVMSLPHPLPCRSDVHELVGRLNFSEAELSVHQLSIHQRSAHTADLFNTSLECEKRVRILLEGDSIQLFSTKAEMLL